MPATPTQRLHPVAVALLLLVDAAIVYVAFVGALKLRYGSWHVVPADLGLATAVLISVFVYLAAQALAGLYGMRPSTMHLDAFLKVSLFMLIGGAVSLTAIYLQNPGRMPPRSVTATQCAFSIIGVLGVRAVIRFALERFGKGTEARPERRPAVDLDRFFRHPPLAFSSDAVQDYLSGRTVLVTGAGGSIGSVLSRRLLELNPFKLVLVDVSEYNLFRLENELRGKRFEGDLVFRIADVRDETIMRTVFGSYRPDIVFHAAAYKHVPLMERHPVEAFTNNTLATVGLVRLCEEYGAEQFVFVSTDKAVDPRSVLGATKRLAEWYVRAAGTGMRCKTVRFGNVMGSDGSVIPTFIDQILGGGPVVLTHPDMRRYFMTADDAATFILESLLLDDAPVFTMRMGDSVSIRDLAVFLIEEIAGSPEAIPVEYAGVRAGEKLEERLWSDDETPVPTQHDRIVGLSAEAPFSRAELDDFFGTLHELCRKDRADELRKELFRSRLDHVRSPRSGD